MTITLNLQPEIERGLQAQANAKGVSLTDYAQEVLAREAKAVSGRVPIDRSRSLSGRPSSCAAQKLGARLTACQRTVTAYCPVFAGSLSAARAKIFGALQQFQGLASFRRKFLKSLNARV